MSAGAEWAKYTPLDGLTSGSTGMPRSGWLTRMRENAAGSLLVKDDCTCARIDAGYFVRFGGGVVLTAVAAIAGGCCSSRVCGLGAHVVNLIALIAFELGVVQMTWFKRWCGSVFESAGALRCEVTATAGAAGCSMGRTVTGCDGCGFAGAASKGRACFGGYAGVAKLLAGGRSTYGGDSGISL